MVIAIMPMKCMIAMPAVSSSGAKLDVASLVACPGDGERRAGDAEHRAHEEEARVPGDLAGDAKACHRGEVHRDGGDADDAAADQAREPGP